MKVRELIIAQLRKLQPDLSYTEADIWDLLPASRGLTVLTNDGGVLPLPLGDGAARQLLHSWSVEARQN